MRKITAIKIPPQEPVPTPTEEKNLITKLDLPRSDKEVIEAFINKSKNEDYDKLLKEVIVRFNTEPRKYEKEDFGKLLEVIIKGYMLSADLSEGDTASLLPRIEYLEFIINSMKAITEDQIMSLYTYYQE